MIAAPFRMSFCCQLDLNIYKIFADWLNTKLNDKFLFVSFLNAPEDRNNVTSKIILNLTHVSKLFPILDYMVSTFVSILEMVAGKRHNSIKTVEYILHWFQIMRSYLYNITFKNIFFKLLCCKYNFSTEGLM